MNNLIINFLSCSKKNKILLFHHIYPFISKQCNYYQVSHSILATKHNIIRSKNLPSNFSSISKFKASFPSKKKSLQFFSPRLSKTLKRSPSKPLKIQDPFPKNSSNSPPPSLLIPNSLDSKTTPAKIERRQKYPPSFQTLSIATTKRNNPREKKEGGGGGGGVPWSVQRQDEWLGPAIATQFGEAPRTHFVTSCDATGFASTGCNTCLVI